MTKIKSVDGYVADLPYPTAFHAEFQPRWIDAILVAKGVEPPRENPASAFKHVDLGCGDGLTLVLAAAASPQSEFIGVDAMEEHVARGQAAATALGLSNVRFIHARFDEAAHLADASADYVTAQGVLAWVSEANQAALLDMTANWLKPGGAFCIGYNCFPGWQMIAPFQALVRATAEGLSGNSTERFEAAVAILKKSDALSADVWGWLTEYGDLDRPEYCAHEYLNAHWQPRWSGHVVAQMAARDCAYVGQSTAKYLRDDWCLTEAWRKDLQNCPSLSAREIMHDVLVHMWFRRDIYVKLPANIYEAEEALARRIENWWMIGIPAAAEEWQTSTAAGQIDFDNKAARAIMAALAEGPAKLAGIASSSGLAAADLATACDALLTARRIMPADPTGDPHLSDHANDWAKQHADDLFARARSTPNGVFPARIFE